MIRDISEILLNIALRVCFSYFPGQNKLDFLYIVASAPKVDLIEKNELKMA